MENSKTVVKRIVSDYVEKEDSRLTELKKLDWKAKKTATIFAYSFGIIGSLVLGTGMCLAMKVIFDLMPLGIVIGIIGIIMVSVNYFMYVKLLNRGKNKYQNQIIELSKELLNE